MKKIITLIVSITLLFVVSIPISASAQEITNDESNSHSYYSIEEVLLTPDMLQEAQIMNVIPQSASLIVSNAACSHTYSAWTTIKSWYGDSTTFAECYILIEYQMRYCTKCNASFARETKTQLSHIKVGNSSTWTCSTCGLKGGYAK